MNQDLQWPTVAEEDLTPFPPVIRAVIKALGFGRAVKFLEQNGGKPVRIPKYKTSVLGVSDLELQRLRESLTFHLNHIDQVTLPKCDKLVAHVRDQIILAEKDHKSIAAQAAEHDLTTRRVTAIRTGNKQRRSEISFSSMELAILNELTQKQAESKPNPFITALADKLATAINPQKEAVNKSQIDLF